jgi:hypothetical protein
MRVHKTEFLESYCSESNNNFLNCILYVIPSKLYFNITLSRQLEHFFSFRFYFIPTLMYYKLFIRGRYVQISFTNQYKMPLNITIVLTKLLIYQRTLIALNTYQYLSIISYRTIVSYTMFPEYIYIFTNTNTDLFETFESNIITRSNCRLIGIITA